VRRSHRSVFREMARLQQQSSPGLPEPELLRAVHAMPDPMSPARSPDPTIEDYDQFSILGKVGRLDHRPASRAR
jgi:hypothetical protein